MPADFNIVVGAGLLIGLAYGVVGLLSGFCLLSSLRGWWAEGDSRLIRTFALALAVAVVATQLLAGYGAVDLTKSIYLQVSFSAPLMFVGGVLFGYGMVLANGCGSRALVLLGRGNLRSLVVVIVLGIIGADDAERLDRAGTDRALAAIVDQAGLSDAAGTGCGRSAARFRHGSIVASVISAVLIIFSFAHAPFRRARWQIAAGVAVGLLVAAGWFATGYLGADDFNPAAVTSLTFVAPVADTVQYVMLSTGLTLNFGIAMVFGVFAGSLLAALVTRRFRLEGYTSPQHMLRSMIGAALMGSGGAMALGCSIGQGLTGISTLAILLLRCSSRHSVGLGRGPARRASCSAAGSADSA